MHFLYHLIISAFFGVAIFLSLSGTALWTIILVITLAGVIMDLDHVAYYGIKYKSKALQHMLADFKNHVHHFYALHTIEFIILTGIIIFFYKPFIFVWLGFVLHLFIDFSTHLSYYTNYAWLTYYSWIYHFLLR